MAPSRKIFALKRIRLTGRDHEAAAGFIDEITLLQRLRGHSNIIQLIDAEVRCSFLFPPTSFVPAPSFLGQTIWMHNTGAATQQ